LEPNLVVALPRTTVGNGRGADLAGHRDHLFGDTGAGEPRDHRIGTLVQPVRLDRLRQERPGVAIDRVDHTDARCAGLLATLHDLREVLVLADVDRHGVHLV